MNIFIKTTRFCHEYKLHRFVMTIFGHFFSAVTAENRTIVKKYLLSRHNPYGIGLVLM